MDMTSVPDEVRQRVEGGVPAIRDNPFQLSQYKNTGMPDTPINFGGGITESLLTNEDVPELLRKKYWWVIHRDNVLTFLDEDRKKSKMLNFDIIKIDLLNNIPYYDYTFSLEAELDVIKNVFETKLDRALGYRTQGVKNERIVLQSQFSEQRQIQEMGNSNIKSGFFSRLLGRR
jgi:hypothetical protein